MEQVNSFELLGVNMTSSRKKERKKKKNRHRKGELIEDYILVITSL